MSNGLTFEINSTQIDINRKKIAVLIVSSNEANWLTKNLESLKIQTYQDFNIFLLDNNCSDDSVTVTLKYFPSACIIHSKENLGFAKGNNILAEKAINQGFDFLFIINPDIELEKHCLTELVNLILTDDNIAAVAPIMFFGLEKKYDFIIQSFVDDLDFDSRIIRSLHANQKYEEGKFEKEFKVNVVSGGITFIRSSIVKKIGLFEENYFIYGEEADLARRIQAIKSIMKVTSLAKVWHHHDFSKKNKQQHFFSYYYMMRSKILYFRKFNLHLRLFKFVVVEIFLFPLKIKWARKTAGIRLLKFYYAGIYDGIRGKVGQTERNFK